MSNLEIQLRGLTLKKAMLLLQIEKQAEIEETIFTQLGKTEAEIVRLKKEIIRKTENNIQ